ncbi:zinc-dependent alcohol dehydrogenase family protein [Temperatibacter marinus]|uniref:Zinc-dependent alcohol dehydrogenase family protein n=1 Tax=Temperatibacter marinus TaxID=1456591 RepID=A0AA52EHC6_9PROT|nr:zinc-dependent alcohol dehydrogenase family protein [Temperatibacter marinus]WND02081.1 zinc-dependent alcohol dehydrogenase family protein [Temperatibacter marinus]
MRSIHINSPSEDLSSLSLIESPKPVPKEGQVLVKMKMAAINPSDINFVRGDYEEALSRAIWNQSGELTLDPNKEQVFPGYPFSLGGEGVGVVEECGRGFMAKRLKGKRVALLAGPPNGAWQEYTAVDAIRCAVVPDHIKDEQAAMFFINPLSAYIMVHHILKVKKGDTILISAGASALGKMVVKMGVHFGFKTIPIVRGPENTDILKSLGATHIIETDTDDLIEAVDHYTQGAGVKHALDCVSGALGSAMVRCLSLGGKMVVYGTLSAAPLTIPSRDLMTPTASITGFFMPNWIGQQNPLKMLWIMKQAARLYRQDILTSPVETIYPLEDFKEAIANTLQTGRVGKSLFKISE